MVRLDIYYDAGNKETVLLKCSNLSITGVFHTGDVSYEN